MIWSKKLNWRIVVRGGTAENLYTLEEGGLLCRQGYRGKKLAKNGGGNCQITRKDPP